MTEFPRRRSNIAVKSIDRRKKVAPCRCHENTMYYYLISMACNILLSRDLTPGHSPAAPALTTGQGKHQQRCRPARVVVLRRAAAGNRERGDNRRRRALPSLRANVIMVA